MTIVEANNNEFYLDGILKRNLEEAKTYIGKDWDVCVLVDGREGSGKSTLAAQMAAFVDNTFDVSRECFTPRQFVDCVKNGSPGQAIVFDEAITGAFSRRAMSLSNQVLVKTLAQCREKKLFLFVVLPSFFDLDRNISIWRSRGLFHCYVKNKERGRFAFFDYRRKKNLFLFGKKAYNYNCTGSSYIGRFTQFFPLNRDEYLKKKLDAIGNPEELLLPKKNADDGTMIQRDNLARFVDGLGYSKAEISRIMSNGTKSITRQRVSKILNS
ncbi:MAG: hypothetical protein V1702_00820 [Candidatus Woesearchaeota archaeon]